MLKRKTALVWFYLLLLIFALVVATGGKSHRSVAVLVELGTTDSAMYEWVIMTKSEYTRYKLFKKREQRREQRKNQGKTQS